MRYLKIDVLTHCREIVNFEDLIIFRNLAGRIITIILNGTLTSYINVPS